VEVLDEGLAAYYYDAGIEFYSAREIADINLVSCVEDGIKLIRCVPGLSATVIALVRTFHLIKPQDDDYDLSFSEPHIPFSIFVSVPTKRSLIHRLRIAEAIVHEAMHLQLTLINKTVPLTGSTSRRYYSPWRKEYRDSQGILHALYVFRVIDRMLEQLASLVGSTRDVTEYIHGRRFDIDGQIRTIRSFQNCPELTRVGASFVGGLTRHSLV
jgi:HEXXH motif-containing protein